MKYVKAQDVLPKEILKIIQEYVDGKYLYIPRKNEVAFVSPICKKNNTGKGNYRSIGFHICLDS